MPSCIVARAKEYCRCYRRVFESCRDGRPLAVKSGETHIKLKADARPKKCPEPRWGNGPLRDILAAWALKQIASGMFEYAPESEWASRIHIAKKVARGATQDDESFGIRVCGDYQYSNSQCVPLQANSPDVPSALV